MPDDDLAGVERALAHRIDGHRAALRTAEALGWPAVLGTGVAETHARLAEAEDCLAVVREARRWALAVAVRERYDAERGAGP